MSEQSFEQAIEEIKKSIARFEKIEGREWGIEGAVIELSKQVGQLSALIMNREKYYYSDREKENAEYTSTNKEIGDELSDIIFAVVRIAQHYDIDLVKINADTRKLEDSFLRSRGV